MKKTPLTETVKQLRKQYGLTQEQLALKSGVGLNFVREMEQGKATVRLLGGDLEICLREEDGHVMMTGPAEEVFTGEWKR